MEGLLNTVSSPAFTTAELKIVVFIPLAKMYPSVEVCALIPVVVVLLQAQKESMLGTTSKKYNPVLSKNLII